MSKHEATIRKMAEREYPNIIYPKEGYRNARNIAQLSNRSIFEHGATAVMESLDVDPWKVSDIIGDWQFLRITDEEAKRQILESITIKEKPCTQSN